MRFNIFSNKDRKKEDIKVFNKAIKNKFTENINIQNRNIHFKWQDGCMISYNSKYKVGDTLYALAREDGFIDLHFVFLSVNSLLNSVEFFGENNIYKVKALIPYDENDNEVDMVNIFSEKISFYSFTNAIYGEDIRTNSVTAVVVDIKEIVSKKVFLPELYKIYPELSWQSVNEQIKTINSSLYEFDAFRINKLMKDKGFNDNFINKYCDNIFLRLKCNRRYISDILMILYSDLDKPKMSEKLIDLLNN